MCPYLKLHSLALAASWVLASSASAHRDPSAALLARESDLGVATMETSHLLDESNGVTAVRNRVAGLESKAAAATAAADAAEADAEAAEAAGGDTVTDSPKPGEPGTYTSPSPLEALGRNVGIVAKRARAASSDAVSAATEVYARFDAEGADLAATHARAAATLTQSNVGLAQGAVREATAGAQGATAAANSANAALAAGQASVAAVTAEAEAAGAKGLKHLAPLYKAMMDWKMTMFHPPTKEAIAAGLRAAKPFNDALQVVEKRVADYNQRAQFLSGQSQALKGAAFGLANAAVGAQAGGNVVQAGKDMQTAHQMVAQAMMFEAQGLKMQDQATLWSTNIPAYIGSAQGAAHTATHRFASGVFAPPPVATGFAGPPPPTGKDVPM